MSFSWRNILARFLNSIYWLLKSVSLEAFWRLILVSLEMFQVLNRISFYNIISFFVVIGWDFSISFSSTVSIFLLGTLALLQKMVAFFLIPFTGIKYLLYFYFFFPFGLRQLFFCYILFLVGTPTVRYMNYVPPKVFSPQNDSQPANTWFLIVPLMHLHCTLPSLGILVLWISWDSSSEHWKYVYLYLQW